MSTLDAQHATVRQRIDHATALSRSYAEAPDGEIPADDKKRNAEQGEEPPKAALCQRTGERGRLPEDHKGDPEDAERNQVQIAWAETPAGLGSPDPDQLFVAAQVATNNLSRIPVCENVVVVCAKGRHPPTVSPKMGRRRIVPLSLT